MIDRPKTPTEKASRQSTVAKRGSEPPRDIQYVKVAKTSLKQCGRQRGSLVL